MGLFLGFVANHSRPSLGLHWQTNVALNLCLLDLPPLPVNDASAMLESGQSCLRACFMWACFSWSRPGATVSPELHWRRPVSAHLRLFAGRLLHLLDLFRQRRHCLALGLRFPADLYRAHPVFAFGWPLLQRIVDIAKRHNITSIADFIAARYGKSEALGALVAVIAVIGVVPYISIQLKAVAFRLRP